MKKLALIGIVLLGCSVAGFADEVKAVYVGGQFGKVNMNYDNSSYKLPANSVDSDNFAGRFYLGYSFTDMLAAELGYGYYGNNTFTHNPDGNKQDMLQQGIDLAAKLSVPLDAGFGFYVKAGGIWLHRSELESRGGFFAEKDANARVSLLGGLGLTYNFTPKWAAEVFWTGTPSNGDLKETYFYGIGLSYKFLKDAEAYN